MIDLSKDALRQAVRDHYSLVAKTQTSGCCDPNAGSSCCGSPASAGLGAASLALGYGIRELEAVPEGANLGLGCGNPQAIASLRPGETVLDLGSGGGFDVFLAARSVGPTGHVVGVDMTPDMVTLARTNAAKAGLAQVEFRLGEIEHLPVANDSVDVILSNCVINLSPEKAQVFREAHRVLKVGGRLAISDMVASGAIPEALRQDLSLHSKCITGATPVDELRALLAEAGFDDIRIQPRLESRSFVSEWAPGTGIEDFIVSATIEAVKRH